MARMRSPVVSMYVRHAAISAGESHCVAMLVNLFGREE
jgi:hypothetical protein